MRLTTRVRVVNYSDNNDSKDVNSSNTKQIPKTPPLTTTRTTTTIKITTMTKKITITIKIIITITMTITITITTTTTTTAAAAAAETNNENEQAACIIPWHGPDSKLHILTGMT